MSLQKGEFFFQHYDEFKQKFEAYQDAQFVIFTVIDSTTVERARKKQPKWLHFSYARVKKAPVRVAH